MRVVAAVLLATAILTAQDAEIRKVDLAPVFGSTVGAFVLYDLNAGQYIRYNDERCRQRFSPFSTFKIPHSVIALETGVLQDAESVIAWDEKLYPRQDDWNVEPFVHWPQDQTLRSAIKYSVVWYYMEVAKRVGPERMNEHVHTLNYGNQDVSGWLSKGRAFWIGGTLQISAEEQIEFLRKFYTGKLGISQRTTGIVKDILVLESTPEWKLSGKTGGGSVGDKAFGWLVGYLEKQGNVYFFAMNMDGSNFGEIRDRRTPLTRKILAELGLIPPRQ
jgi:beta-lactamase class D